MTEKHEHVDEAEATFVLAALEHDQLVDSKKARLPRRRLQRGHLLLLWALRIYLVFMLAVVFWQTWKATH